MNFFKWLFTTVSMRIAYCAIIPPYRRIITKYCTPEVQLVQYSTIQYRHPPLGYVLVVNTHWVSVLSSTHWVSVLLAVTECLL